MEAQARGVDGSALKNVRIAVLTTGRQDWGILRSTCTRLANDPAFAFELWVGGMHLEEAFGKTVRLIEADGFVPTERLAFGAGRDAAAEAAAAITSVGDAVARRRPDALLLLGDRSETAAAALAATLMRVPLVHVHGGEETEGAIDNVLRHAISKMAHLHLVSHAAYRARLVSLGEAPETIHVVGAPGLDNLQRADLATRAELEASLGLPLTSPLVLVTVHPTTLPSAEPGLDEVEAVIAAMDAVDATYVVTLPNSDAGNESIRRALVAACGRPNRVAADALGERRYWGLMRIADAMLGNSSSGVIEAPSLGLPVVNVGDRQRGRLRAPNVLDVPVDAMQVVDALRRALSPSFRAAAEAATTSFGDGHSGERILSILRRWTPPSPPRKVAVP